MAKEMISNEMKLQDIQQTIKIGQRALNSLYAAKSKLNDAEDWGVLDIFGGGPLSTYAKYSKIDSAALEIAAAKRDLQNFQIRLRDVQTAYDMKVEIDSFLSFADFFLDGLIVDSIVQSKISGAKRQIADAVFKVETMIKSLKAREEALKADCDE